MTHEIHEYTIDPILRVDELVVPTEFERYQWVDFRMMYKQAKKDGFLVFPAA
jgi:hypothetical protein